MSRNRIVLWNPNDHEDCELWVCESCGAELHVDCVGDICPSCGEPAEGADATPTLAASAE